MDVWWSAQLTLLRVRSRRAPGGRGTDWSGPVAMLGPAVASAVEPHQPLVLEPDKAMYQAWISSKVRTGRAHARARRAWSLTGRSFFAVTRSPRRAWWLDCTTTSTTTFLFS